MDVARFVRQVLLPEIGEAGQRRIGAAEAEVGGAGLAHEVAARYAEGAGFGAIVAGDVDVAALAPAAIVKTEAAREVLAGSRAALAELRRAVEMESFS
jgi:hypothetical protein